MKLSEAIEKGSVNRDQVRGDMLDTANEGVCAMGAALLGTGFGVVQLMEADTFEINRVYSANSWRGDVVRAVVLMNDDKEMSFSEIVKALKEKGL